MNTFKAEGKGQNIPKYHNACPSAKGNDWKKNGKNRID